MLCLVSTDLGSPMNLDSLHGRDRYRLVVSGSDSEWHNDAIF